MWVLWRPKQSVAITESWDGIHWSPLETVLGPRPEAGWEDDINRPVVVHRADEYHMWYTGQAKGRSFIGYATGPDGRSRKRQSDRPVLEASAAWEGVALMCPHVIWDGVSRKWKMRYSGGQQYEPNAIGYRPTINSYMFGDPVAISKIAEVAGESRTASRYQAKADKLRKLIESRLWNPHDQFYETTARASDGGWSNVSELIGYIPWYFEIRQKITMLHGRRFLTRKVLPETMGQPRLNAAAEVCISKSA